MKTIILITSLLASSAYAGMSEMNEEELQSATAQSGVTLSSRVEFGNGTRISYTNSGAQYLDDSQEYWLVINNLTGGLEMKGLKIDLINDFGPSASIGAVQITLPEEINYESLSMDGMYLGPGKEVSGSHRFIMGMDINGQLQFPAETRMNIFAIQ